MLNSFITLSLLVTMTEPALNTECEAKSIGFGTGSYEDLARLSQSPKGRLYDVPYANMGKEKRKISWKEFYQYVGHPDVGSAYQRRMWTFLSFGAGSILAFVATSLVGWSLIAVGPMLVLANILHNKQLLLATQISLVVLLGLGLIFLVVGGSTATVASLMRTQPISDEEIRAMADIYNRKLCGESAPAVAPPTPSSATPLPAPPPSTSVPPSPADSQSESF